MTLLTFQYIKFQRCFKCLQSVVWFSWVALKSHIYTHDFTCGFFFVLFQAAFWMWSPKVCRYTNWLWLLSPQCRCYKSLCQSIQGKDTTYQFMTVIVSNKSALTENFYILTFLAFFVFLINERFWKSGFSKNLSFI